MIDQNNLSLLDAIFDLKHVYIILEQEDFLIQWPHINLMYCMQAREDVEPAIDILLCDHGLRLRKLVNIERLKDHLPCQAYKITMLCYNQEGEEGHISNYLFSLSTAREVIKKVRPFASWRSAKQTIEFE